MNNLMCRIRSAMWKERLTLYWHCLRNLHLWAIGWDDEGIKYLACTDCDAFKTINKYDREW